MWLTNDGRDPRRVATNSTKTRVKAKIYGRIQMTTNCKGYTSLDHVIIRSQRHGLRQSIDLGATVMDLARRRGTCKSHVGGSSCWYHVVSPTWGQLRIRTYRRNSRKYDSDRFDFSSPISSINTYDPSSFGTYSLLSDIWASRTVRPYWLDRRSACRYPHRQVSGRRAQTTAPEAKWEVMTAVL
jgi:hypothetical protein